MKRLIGLLAVIAALLFAPAIVHAGCTTTVAITTASKELLPNDDITGGRSFLFIQNTGATTVNCTIGGTTATTSVGIQLVSGDSITLTSLLNPAGHRVPAPSGQVLCIAASSTDAVTACDY